MIYTKSPILSITIPTFNRAAHLWLNLQQLVKEFKGITQHAVEIVISDNASDDETPNVIQEAIEAGLHIRYIRNHTNIGSDANFAQCFNLAMGRYVIIMGDDDQFTDGSLKALVDELQHPFSGEQYGVVCMRTYAFEVNAKAELPYGSVRSRVFIPDNFLIKAGNLLTFISGMVINKSIIADVDAREFCGGQLVQVYLVLRAALRSKQCLYMNRYMLACMRSSSPAFDYGKVFVQELGTILDEHIQFGLKPNVIRKIENRMLYTLLPYLALRQRIADVGDPKGMYVRISIRYKARYLSRVFIKPILTWPRSFAIAWGSLAVTLGRLANGEGLRAIWLIWNRALLFNKRWMLK